MTAIDLDAYLARIGYAGERAPTLATLTALHALHPQAIPFENLDPLLGRPVRLDAASLERKLVHDGRGGWCFEQNLLFRHALEALGFETTALAGRVLWSQPTGRVGPRTHMLLRVDVDGDAYLADVGFGGLTLTAPLRLHPVGVEQATPHEPFRVRGYCGGAESVVEARLRGAWAPLYRFDRAEQLLPDYEVASWYLSTHPASHFRQTVIAARAAGDRRHALRDGDLAVHHPDGRTERRTLRGAAELREALTGVFGIRLPDDPALDATLDRLTSDGAGVGSGAPDPEQR